MFTFYDENPDGLSNEPSNPTVPADSTDRVNGEYRYKNGYTQRIYSDAHYVPEKEST